MKIGIAGSMQFTEEMLKLQKQLQELGHIPFLTSVASAYIGKSDKEKEILKIHQKHSMDTIREFWELMQGADALLIANYDKNGIANYIGGATLIEMGFAHILKQKIFLLNPIPNIDYYKTEIEAVKPIIIHGDLSKIV